MDAFVIMAVVLALAAGALIGWLLGQRSLAALRAELAVGAEKAARLTLTEESVREVTEQRDLARSEVSGLRPLANRAAEADAELQRMREEVRALGEAKAAFAQGQVERERAFSEQLAQVKELEAKLERRFGELAGKAVESAHDSFLKRASEKLGAEARENQAKLHTLLQPVEHTLKRYEQSLGEIEKARQSSYGELKNAVTQLTQGNDQVRRETQRLANVMVSSPKARGRWAEEQLKTILETAGLSEHVDFFLQSSVSDDGKMLRPDCVIKLPNNRCIVVDVKCPLVHFEQAFDEDNDEIRSGLLMKHADALRTYANDLGRKSYWRQFDISPDFVIMFIRGEHSLSAAAERDPDLIESAFRNGVIIASTINLLALAKIMAGMWRQEALAAQAHEVAEVGKELYRKLSAMGGHVGKLGRNLAQATGAYNDFVGSLEQSVLTQARKFEGLGIETSGKALDSPPLVEAAPRPLTKLTLPRANDQVTTAE